MKPWTVFSLHKFLRSFLSYLEEEGIENLEFINLLYFSVMYCTCSHCFLNFSKKKIFCRFFRLSANKCHNPMKIQNETVSTECTSEFSKIIHSCSFLIQQIFLQVSYSLWSSVHKYGDARLKNHYYSFSFPGAQHT